MPHLLEIWMRSFGEFVGRAEALRDISFLAQALEHL
jgi:hypothetical protein